VGKRDTETQKTESMAWIVSMRLVRTGPTGDQLVAVVPDMEFSSSWMGKVAKRHGTLCAHPTELSCQILRRAAEYLRSQGRVKGSGLESMGKAR